MKNITYILLFIWTVLTVTGCGNDWLDRFPSNATPSDTAISSYEDLQSARVGMYDGLQGNSTFNSYYAARMIYYGDVRGDDMQARTQGMRSSRSYEMDYNVDNAPTIWNVPYNLIRRANNIINAIDNNKVEDGTEAQIRSIYAEALTMRALAHFDMVRVYGNPFTKDNGASLGIPIVTELLDADALPSRNTVAEVYTQVIKDLTTAINSGYMATARTQGYFNVWAAKALLARVYLHQGDMKNALEVAEDILNDSEMPYTLWANADYPDVWLKSHPAHTNEMMLEIINVNANDWTDREGIAYLYHEQGYADAIATKSFMEMMAGEDPDDIRIQVVLPAQVDKDLIATYGDNRVFINKYPSDPEANGEMRFNNIPLLRLSEVYLTAAEAAFKENDADKAARYLNPVILRANPNATSLTAGQVTLQRIINERRKELIGEGQRFFDAIRNNETITRYTDENNRGYHYTLNSEAQQFTRDYFRVILPIPVDEINANENLKAQQNPGY